MALSPTLWRTCRVLAGKTRLALYRRIIQSPGQSVSALAGAERISVGRASQELRRLQARGVVGVRRDGRHAFYYPESDPLVLSAQPILAAMREVCRRLAPSSDARTARLARGLAHEKRIAMVRALRQGPMAVHELQARLKMPSQTLWYHLRFLKTGGWIVPSRRRWKLEPSGHPLAKCLLQLI